MKVLSTQKQTVFLVVVLITAFLLGYISCNKVKNGQIEQLKEWNGRNLKQELILERKRPLYKVVMYKVGDFLSKKSGV